MLGDYVQTLRAWAREDGLTSPVYQNSTNPVFNSEFREMAVRMGEDYLLGGDHYYMIDMDCDGVPHPDVKFATKTLYSLEQSGCWAVRRPSSSSRAPAATTSRR